MNSRIILLLLIIISFTVFARRLLQLFKFINLGKGELRFDNIGNRIKSVFKNGFGQRLVLREPSGFGHFCIFWGFIFLTFGTIEELIIGLLPGFSFSFLGPVYSFMNTMQDILAFFAVMAICVSLVRRFIIKPKRLEADMAHKLDALFILSLISLLIFSFYIMRAIHPKPGFLPVAGFLSESLSNILKTEYYHFFDWTHNIVVLFFLAYIPYSKHIHLVGALPNLFFHEESHPGVMEKLYLEDDKAESFGVAKICDYSKKHILDLYACTECGRCQENCPAYATDKPLSPKNVVLDLKSHLFKEGPALLKDPNAETKTKIFGDTITADAAWACTTCRACEAVCPELIKPMNKLFGIRQNRVLMEGDFPEEAQLALKNVETQSNPWGLSQEERGKWAKDLNIKLLSEDSNAEYLYFVGCSGSYDERNIEVTKAVVSLLQKGGVSFVILGSGEFCCGDSARRIGNEYLAQTLAQQNVETFNKYNVKKIITACPHGYNTIKNEYPQFGGNYEVYHHSEIISGLLSDCKLKPANTNKGVVTYHDSCYLGRYNNIFKAPRDIINSIPGTEFVEMDRKLEKSFCCGAGGGRMWMEEKMGTPINVNRIKEAIFRRAEIIATACPFCLTMMTDGLKNQGKDEEIKVLDVAEVIDKNLIS
ncbi:MAG: (Fe-S)-binding protein [bacterium]